MKDKEFDQLFKDRLGDAEIQPALNLWNNIAEELKPHKRKVFSVYWIAAAVTVIIGSVMWVFPKEEKIRLQGKPLLVNNTVLPSSETSSINHRHSKIISKPDENTYESTPLVIAPRLTEVYSGKEILMKRPVMTADSVTQKVDHINETHKPIDVPDRVYTDIAIVKAVLPDEININASTENEVSTRGIKNVGDFVNYVVSKVDKREDKFLKFNTDDDNSSLVGINIGFIKLNLKRNK